MTHVLTQPAFLLATALVPDRTSPHDYRRKYGLVRVGTCYYALVFKNPDLSPKNQMRLQEFPIGFLQKRHFPQAVAGENEQGYLVYHQRRLALTWFLNTFIRHASGVLTLKNEDRHRENNLFRAAVFTLYRAHHRPPEDNEVQDLTLDDYANPDDRFLVTLDTFALRQITHFEAEQEPPSRAFFEDHVGTLIGFCVDEYWIAEGPFEHMVTTCTTLLISTLQQTRGLALPDRAERLVSELLTILKEDTLPRS